MADSMLRNWFFTYNNPIETEEQFYELLFNLPDIQYFGFQLEQGEEKETKHFQGYIEFKIGKRLSTMKKYIPKAHFEKRKGSKKQVYDYISKEETRIGQQFYEFGELVEERKRTDITAIVELIQDGASDIEILEEYPSSYLRYQNHISSLRQKILFEKYSKVERDVKVIYLWGLSGTGKTYSIIKEFGYDNIYRVPNYKNPFDNYSGQKVLVLEEFRTSIPFNELLNITDIYPTTLSSRYNDKVACYEYVFIVSNIPLEQQYDTYLQEHEPESWKAFLRRLDSVYHLPNDQEKYYEFLKNKDKNTKELAEEYFGEKVILQQNLQN